MSHAFFDDTPKINVENHALSPDWLTRTQTVFRNALALCQAARMLNLKAFDKKIAVLCLTQPDLNLGTKPAWLSRAGRPASHTLHMPGGCSQMFWAPWCLCGAVCDAPSSLCKAGRVEAHAIGRAVGETRKAIPAQIVCPLIVAPWQVSRLQKNVFGMRPRGDKLHKNWQRPRCCEHLVNACFCCRVVSA